MAWSADEILEGVEPRMLLLILFSAVGLTVTAAYFYMLEAPIKDYVRLHRLANASAMEIRTERREVSDARVRQLEQEVERLEQTLYGQTPQLASSEMVSYIIGQLDVLAKRHGVQLVGVKPGSVARVLMFEEIPFDVEVSGSYVHLFDWLQEAERALHPMVMKEFHIAEGAGHPRLNMKLRVVSYRPYEGEQR
ncbi:MAG: type 4a pilus biogenesis protein PilO [Gammaproteobacteria bacterium]|nr:type 4a pilus biogenesis protein PilO [Gammaproteobacteria bacterium]NIR84564.1 type 4a pilus biogenesis protein PilO [Gammaproteobacteria bacterium]NIR90467.1 type 4a pilus biogenesis protein PilO [Gammaproteobacteria bacterium]NIU05615.1 type 4a pilus biogenesis protein PilO [Gammaproteobacteria bacterium]NIV52754.1 type 4a pilus biogenesis protein PilO [Gammaproteobacteria bacterium]